MKRVMHLFPALFFASIVINREGRRYKMIAQKDKDFKMI